MIHPYENGTLLRIEPVKPGRDSIEYECVAENGVGDAEVAHATLTVHEGKFIRQQKLFIIRKNKSNNKIHENQNEAQNTFN